MVVANEHTRGQFLRDIARVAAQFFFSRCMEHNRNFDVAQVMTRLRTIMSVMQLFEGDPKWK